MQQPTGQPTPAILLVDHGSKRPQANALLEDVADMLRQQHPGLLVAVAHMELAPPTVRESVAALVAQGATRIVVHPYFLGPGRHAQEDIPALAREAAQAHPNVTVQITEPLGIHPLMGEIIMARVSGARALD